MGERQQAGAGGESQERQQEARRILDRLERESTGAQGIVQRGMTRTANHLSASDADRSDPIEIWATRFGRGLGLLITFAIIIWLITYLMHN